MIRFLKSLFSPPPEPASRRESYTIREGKAAKTDEAFDAWTSSDSGKMLKASKKKTNLIDRHFLLMGIVDQTYKQRQNPSMRSKFYEYADLHLNEFPRIAPALKRDMGGELPRVTTFQKFATVLAEDGNFEEAKAVCQSAISYGLEDGTKSGFEGRLSRIGKMEKKETKVYRDRTAHR